MSKAHVVTTLGGPESMQWQEHPVGEPGPGQVRLKHTAVGLNYIDVYFRSGVYPAPQLPFVPGMEGAGTIEALGEGVEGFGVGDRVAYATPPLGAYCEVRVMAADRLVKIPQGVSDSQAAAVMLKGMTAQYLLKQTFQVKPGMTVLFHAAAGGVGLIACQWARHLGATVIGTAGSQDKMQLARAYGCHHVINYRDDDFVKRVAEITDGNKAEVVYDGVGAATFEGSLDCVAPRGMLVMFGNASGKVAPFDITALSGKGSIYLARPTLFHHIATKQELNDVAQDVFSMVKSGAVKIPIGQTFPLCDAVQAHRALEGRKTTGSTVLLA